MREPKTNYGENLDTIPAIVFRIEQEISGDKSDAGGDSDEDQENEEHESKHIVDLVCPERCEDKVHLDEDAAKW